MRIGSVILGQFSFLTAQAQGLRAGKGLSASRGGRSDTGERFTLAANDRPSVFSAGRGTDPLVGVQTLLARLRRLSAETLAGNQQSSQQPLVSVVQTVPTRPITQVVSNTLTGVNSAQVAVSNLQVLPLSGHRTIQGTVTQAAGAAKLTVAGASGATATAGGTYSLSGPRGSITVDLEAGESLHDVAARINQQAAASGVTADVVSNNLVLTSSDLGQAATVQLQPLEIDPIVETSFNAAQIDEVEVSSLTPGATEVISGSVVSTAQGAELVYRGGAGSTVSGTAAFDLTGTRGATSVTIAEGESLAAVAQRINDQTATTGVVATVDGNDLRLISDTLGDTALVRVDFVELDHDTSISGVNPAQVADLAVVSLADGSEHVLAGEVTRSASKATVYLQGAANATVIDTGSFELSGALGAATISITQGESLANVASRVNAETESTGVSARVAGTQVVLESVAVGSSAEVNVELLSIAHTNVVTGVNSQQLTSFQVNQFTQGATHSLSGFITQTAGQAELVFTGFAGFVGTTSTFTLTGSLGSVQLSTTGLQSLSALATQVNQNSATTGVTAVVQGSQLKLRSAGVGSAATVRVNVTSGSFNVTGGNGNGTANGANAIAVINGQTITGSGNQFQLTDALGTYTFTAASGFTGAISTVSIESQAGSFELSGGDGNGTATGLDALAVINSVALTGVGNRFTVGEAGGDFELEFAAGFVGEFAAITVESTPDAFEIEGGDGAGTAVGADAVAIINGVEHTSADSRFAVEGVHGDYEIQFAADFVGSFDPITVESKLEELVIDGDEEGLASGADAEALINGQQYVGTGGRIQVAQDGLQITLDFQAGFTGAFDPITIIQQTRTVNVISAPAPVIVTTAPTDTTSPPADDPLAVLLQELDDLIVATEREPTAASDKTPATATRPSRAEIVRRLFIQVHQDGPPAWSKTYSELTLPPSLLPISVDLLA